MQLFFHGGVTPSHLHARILQNLQNLQNPGFQLALRSPFTFISHTAIPPPAALFDEINKGYLLFFNGLFYYSTERGECQQKNLLLAHFFVNVHNDYVFIYHLISFFPFSDIQDTTKILQGSSVWSII